MPIALQYLMVVILGLIVGSFANVCIYRLPRQINIVYPASACVSCGKPIRFYDNIPFVSYLILRGRCRHCNEPISLRYPLVELLNTALYLLAYLRFGFDYSLLAIMPFLTALLVITFIDLEFQIIPDSITLPGILIGMIFAVFLFPDPFEELQKTGLTNSLIGLFVGGGLFFLIAVLSRGGMGGGDIKMMAMIGALMGWKAVLLTTMIGSLAGSVVGIGLMIIKGKDRKTKIPFGPFLALGAVMTLFYGRAIMVWYLGDNL